MPWAQRLPGGSLPVCNLALTPASQPRGMDFSLSGPSRANVVPTHMRCPSQEAARRPLLHVLQALGGGFSQLSVRLGGGRKRTLERLPGRPPVLTSAATENSVVGGGRASPRTGEPAASCVLHISHHQGWSTAPLSAVESHSWYPEGGSTQTRNKAVLTPRRRMIN